MAELFGTMPHAANHLSGGIDDLYTLGGHQTNPALASPNGRIETFPHMLGTTSLTVPAAAKYLFLTEFTPAVNMTVANLYAICQVAFVISAGTVTDGFTMGLFQVTSPLNYQCLKLTTPSNTLFNATGLITAALTSGQAIVAGTRYAVGTYSNWTSSGSTAPSLKSAFFSYAGEGNMGSGFTTDAVQLNPAAAPVVSSTYVGVATSRCFWFGLGN